MKHSVRLLILLCILVCFTGCVTTKYVPTPVTVSDTSKQVSNDSTLNRRFVEAFESLMRSQEKSKEIKTKEVVYEKDSIAPRYDNSGNKTGEDRYHTKIIDKKSTEVSTLKDKVLYLQSYKDSCLLYKNKIDSLQKEKSKTTPYYIEKKLSGVHKFLIVMGSVFVGFVLLYLTLVFKNLYKKRKS